MSKCNIRWIRSFELWLPCKYISSVSTLSREALTVCVLIPHPLRYGAESFCCVHIRNWQVIWSESWKREKETEQEITAHRTFVQKSILQPSCRFSACCSQWEQRRHLLSTSLLSSTRPPVCLCTLLFSPSLLALLFQLKPPRHAVGVWVVQLLLWRWGWNVLNFNALTLCYV